MQEADFAMTEQAMRDHDRRRGDENLYVKFFTQPLENREASLKEGRPMYDDAEFISIMVPGDKDNIIVRTIRQEDLDRFPRQYEAYKNKQEDLGAGTPLERWGFLTLSQAEELKFFNIFTVEQLANVSDGNAQKFMGIQKLKRSAQEYIETSKSEAPALQLQDDLARSRIKTDQLERTVAVLQNRLDKLDPEGNTEKKPGFFSRS